MSASEVSIGPARDSDLDQLVALDARSFSQVDRYGRRKWAGILNESLGMGPARIVVARSARRIVGAVVVVPDLERLHASIMSIAVELRYRRTGVARRLMYAALAQLSAHIRTVSLEVREENGAARALYERLGFQRSRKMRRHYADGAAALEYRAPIQSVLEAACVQVDHGGCVAKACTASPDVET
jgi:[ribosomal protein S18]-alanine N-acetyltransferase